MRGADEGPSALQPLCSQVDQMNSRLYTVVGVWAVAVHSGRSLGCGCACDRSSDCGRACDRSSGCGRARGLLVGFVLASASSFVSWVLISASGAVLALPQLKPQHATCTQHPRANVPQTALTAATKCLNSALCTETLNRSWDR
jgi:hypothetical protein